MRRRTCVWAAAALLALFCGTAARGQVGSFVEFGDSVKFGRPYGNLRMSQLRGKAVCIVFFQSWCGICNGWAPNLVKQMQDTYGNKRGVVLVAVKTDGGGTGGAEGYLRDKGANPGMWVVGSDANAKWYTRVIGKAGLWDYALVNTEGRMVEKGPAGAVIRGSKTFWLTRAEAMGKCGKPRCLLPAGKKYPSALAGAARLAEMGLFKEALRACSASARTAGRDAAQGLRKDIESAAARRIEVETAVLQDDKVEWGARYEAYKSLTPLLAQFRSTPEAREALPVVRKMGATREIRNERAAEKYYGRVMATLAGKITEARQRTAARNLAGLARKYPNTKYGKLAADMARSLGAPAPR